MGATIVSLGTGAEMTALGVSAARKKRADILVGGILGSFAYNLLVTLGLAAWRLEDRMTRETSPQLALTRFTDPPDSARRAALLRLVKQLRQEVADLAADYQLEVAEESFVRSTMGEFTLLWSDLEDSRPQKLRRYGAIHPQADEVLGPSIQRLIELVLAINDVAGGKNDSPTDNL